MSYNGTTEGAVATYQCDGGYSLSGNVERVCQGDGNWNGQVPQCTESEHLTNDKSDRVCMHVLASIYNGEVDNFICPSAA